MARGRASARAPRARGVIGIVTALALLTLASAGLFAWQRFGPSPAVAADTAALGGLTARVSAAAWMDFDMGHVMDGQGGFMMPDQMMPGAPSGDEVRLGVSLTLTNTGTQTYRFNLADEFWLIGGAADQPVPLSADSVGTLPRLAPGAAVDGVLYFDTPVPAEGDPPLYLWWRRDHDDVRITVPMTADPPEHQHG